jgi:poly(hydroxyalkanoate) depolymerase family esterase
LNESLRHLLREAARLTAAGQLREATATIQRALRPGHAPAAGSPDRAPAASPPPADDAVIDIEARVVEPGREHPTASAPATAPRPAPAPARAPAPAGTRSAAPGGASAAAEALAPEAPAARGAAAPPGRFLSGSFTAAAGTRPYKLFVPGGEAVQPRPLLVLLHGCKQNPDDFAAGTRMNELAQAQGWVVLYPAQPHTANSSGCWNWFQAADQRRERGEPAILAGMARHVIDTENVDPHRVYVAGLSAGGAMAAILAATHPDLFAAVGIHSGLPHGAAHDLMTALAAMRSGPSKAGRPATLPAIVFHGDRDSTVHPSNGEALIAQVAPTAVSNGPPRVETGRAPGGHHYTRSIHFDASGRPQAEHWLVHGAGHAWSGGSAAGSYTDPKGPDASAEMLRFFAAYRVSRDASAGTA